MRERTSFALIPNNNEFVAVYISVGGLVLGRRKAMNCTEQKFPEFKFV
jgi:hypothetical protein